MAGNSPSNAIQHVPETNWALLQAAALQTPVASSVEQRTRESEATLNCALAKGEVCLKL